MRWNGVKGLFAAFAALAALDLVLVATAEPIRDVVGRAEGVGLLIRGLPSLSVFCVCSWAYLRSRSGAGSRARIVLILSVVFAALGLLALLPWVGMFAVMFTPISLLYFTAVIWMPWGFFVAVALTAAFILLNVAIARVAQREVHKALQVNSPP